MHDLFFKSNLYRVSLEINQVNPKRSKGDNDDFCWEYKFLCFYYTVSETFLVHNDDSDGDYDDRGNDIDNNKERVGPHAICKYIGVF